MENIKSRTNGMQGRRSDGGSVTNECHLGGRAKKAVSWHISFEATRSGD